VLSWLSLGLVASALAVGTHWLANRVDAIGRPRAFPWVSVALLTVLATASAVPGLLTTLRERHLAEVATTLVGAPAGVRCQSLGEAFVDAGVELGYVRFRPDGTPEHATLIKRDQCRDLAAYARSAKRDPSQAQVVAVHVLTHEAMHMAGIVDEARAECAAVQRDAQTARLLGAAAADARLLAVRYWRTVYPSMPEGYQSPECAAGRSLDEGGADAPWAAAG
jgi:hypothetical protein